MIVDGFTFFNESSLLIARLNYLSSVCDLFVVCEASRTHQGEPKPFMAKNIVKEARPDLLDKIRFIECHDLPIGLGDDANWERERYQRNAIMRGLYDLDINSHIIICDIDEIPSIQAILNLVENNLDGIKPTALQMSMHMYSADLQLYFNGKPFSWEQGRICTLKHLASPQWLRKCKEKNVLENGGWHLTYMGGIDQIKNKIKAFCHAEFNNSYYIDQLEGNMTKRIDPYARAGYDLRRISITKIPREILRSDKNYFFPRELN